MMKQHQYHESRRPEAHDNNKEDGDDVKSVSSVDAVHWSTATGRVSAVFCFCSVHQLEA